MLVAVDSRKSKFIEVFEIFPNEVFIRNFHRLVEIRWD